MILCKEQQKAWYQISLAIPLEFRIVSVGSGRSSILFSINCDRSMFSEMIVQWKRSWNNQHCNEVKTKKEIEKMQYNRSTACIVLHSIAQKKWAPRAQRTTSWIKITMKTFTFTSPAILLDCVWSIIILMLFCSRSEKKERETTTSRPTRKTSWLWAGESP